MITKEALLALIAGAFADVRRDEDCTLHQAQLADQSLSREISEQEWNAEKSRDPETDWQDVPAEALDRCDAAMSHATPQSWRFYLPAFMTRALSLLDADLLETAFPGNVIFQLTYENNHPGLGAYVLDRFRTLNEAQHRTVGAFLEYIREYPATEVSYSAEASEALKGYWGLSEEERPKGIVIAH